MRAMDRFDITGDLEPQPTTPEPEYPPDEPNPNNSDGFSDVQLKERLREDAWRDGIWLTNKGSENPGAYRYYPRGG